MEKANEAFDAMDKLGGLPKCRNAHWARLDNKLSAAYRAYISALAAVGH